MPEPSEQAVVEAKPKRKAIGIVSILLTVLNVAGLVIIGPVIAFMNGQFVPVFKDMGVQLPLLTQWVLDIPWLWYSVVGLVVAIALIVAEYVMKNKKLTSGINIAVGVLVLIWLLIYCAAMILPMLSIVNSVA